MEKGKVLLLTRDNISENIKILTERNDKRKNLIKRFFENNVMIRKITYSNLSLEELDQFLEEWNILGINDEEPLLIVDEKLISPLQKEIIEEVIEDLKEKLKEIDLFLFYNEKTDYNYKKEIIFDKKEKLDHFNFYKVYKTEGFFVGLSTIKKWKEMIKLGRKQNVRFLKDLVSKSVEEKSLNCVEIWPPIFYPNLSQITKKIDKIEKVKENNKYYFLYILILLGISFLIYKYFFRVKKSVIKKIDNKNLKGILRIL